MQQLINLPQRGSESIFTLARPLLPIQKIEYYFQDPQFLETYNFNHNGLQIASKQGSTVHAPLDGLVIKAIDNMDFGINRMMILSGKSCKGKINNSPLLNKLQIRLFLLSDQNDLPEYNELAEVILIGTPIFV